MDKICVCVLAHNEQNNIEKTLTNIYGANREIEFDLKLYANGCTDKTAPIARGLRDRLPRLQIRDLPVASKSLAWNTAFFENSHDILIFSDADIRVEQGTINELCLLLRKDKSTVIVSSTMHPLYSGLPLTKRTVACMQMPVAQDFLYGGFYAARRNALAAIFRDLVMEGIPGGIVGEDAFLELLVGAEGLRVCGKKCYFEPPNAEEYCAYLARIEWQNERLKMCLSKSWENVARTDVCKKVKMLRKVRLLAASTERGARVFAFFSRAMFRCLFARRISAFSRAMGPLTYEGACILADISRSKSCK
jgi:glycosyltransferase involved in cell wall biosynthesis